MKATTVLTIGICALAMWATHAVRATVITVDYGPTDETLGLPVSETDLINTGQVTFSSISLTSGSALFGSSVNKLNDGNKYGGESLGATGPSLVPSDGAVVTVTLDTTSSPSGYGIAKITSLTAYTGVNRLGQRYDLAVHQVGIPGFSNIASVNVPSTNEVLETQVSITGDGGAPLALGVDELRFTFFNNDPEGDNVGAVFREIDVLAVGPVPEPATVLLLAAGGLLLWARRIRNNG